MNRDEWAAALIAAHLRHHERMNRDEWAAALIAAMGWSMGVRDGIVAQAYSEGSRALRNPLDTTEPWPGSWPYNSAGVQNYASTQDGIAATKVTLQNGYYNAVLSAGRVGDSTAYVRAVAGSPWGTWSNTRDADNALAIVRGDPSLGQVEVVGTEEPPEGVEDVVYWITNFGQEQEHLAGVDPRDNTPKEWYRIPGGKWIPVALPES